MDDDLSGFVATRAATPEQPLLGLTVLVVEDSHAASAALRLLCLRSGARIRRADCLEAAHRHLRVYRPSVAIIDLGLPDGPGLGLIAELSTAHPRLPAIIAISGDESERQAALTAGADGFIAKPVLSLAFFQQTIIACLPREVRPAGPRLVAHTDVGLDALALREDLAHAVRLLEQREDPLAYIVAFLRGVAQTAHDSELLAISRRLAACLADGHVPATTVRALRGMLDARLSRLAAVV